MLGGTERLRGKGATTQKCSLVPEVPGSPVRALPCLELSRGLGTKRESLGLR